MVLEKIWKLFKKKEDIQVRLKNSASFIEERNEEEINHAEEEFRGIQDEIEEILEDLKGFLEDLKNYSDPQNRSVIEDVSQNIYRDRKRLIEKFGISEDPEKLLEDLGDFIEDFETLKIKENKVLDHVEPSRKVFERFKDIKKTKKDLKRILEDRYSVIKRKKSLERVVSEIENLEEEVKGLENKIGGFEASDISERIEEAEEELEEIEESPEWSKISEKRKKIDSLKEDKKDISRKIGEIFSSLERGLKKIIYNAENSDVEISGSELDLLKEVKNGEKKVFPDNLIEDLKRIAEEKDIISGRYEDAFLEALESISKVPQLREKRKSIVEEISGLKEELENLNIEARKEEKMEEIETLKEEKSDIERKRKRLEEKKESKKDAISRKVDRIQNMLNKEFYDNIEVIDRGSY